MGGNGVFDVNFDFFNQTDQALQFKVLPGNNGIIKSSVDWENKVF